MKGVGKSIVELEKRFENEENRSKMKKNAHKIILLFVTIIVAMTVLVGCDRESKKVSYNISKQADNFNVVRRLTVFNMRTDKCLMQMTGKMSIQNEGNNEISVIVEIDRDKNIYQKHFVYLNDWTMYTVEDITGVAVSRYAYEIEFMPQTLVPIRVTTDEISQDLNGDE